MGSELLFQACTSRARTEEQTKMPVSQFLRGRGLTTYFPSCCRKVQLPIDLHLGTYCSLPFGILKSLDIPLTTRSH